MPSHRGLVARSFRPVNVGHRYARAFTSGCIRCELTSSVGEARSVTHCGLSPFCTYLHGRSVGCAQAIAKLEALTPVTDKMRGISFTER